MTARVLVAVALLPFALGAAKKDRDWKTGDLVAEAEEREVAGSTGLNQGAFNREAIVYATRVGYVINGGGVGFMVELRVLPSTIFRHSKRPSVTVHGPVKYSYENGRFFLLDEQGQEFELIIMKKELLPPPAAVPSAPAPAPPKL